MDAVIPAPLGFGRSGDGEDTGGEDATGEGEGPDTGEVLGPFDAQFQLETMKAAAFADLME